MALNYIWIAFFLVAFVVAILKLIFLGDTQVFGDMVQSTFDMAKVSVDISIYLIGVISLWQGIMKIGEEGGAVYRLFLPNCFPNCQRIIQPLVL
jgi:spore maturation protein SpmA